MKDIRIFTPERDRKEQLYRLLEESMYLSSEFVLAAIIEKMEQEITAKQVIDHLQDDAFRSFDTANTLCALWNGYFD